MARIATGQLAQLCHRIGTALQAGVDVIKIFNSEAHRGSPSHRNRMSGVRERLGSGETVSVAFREADGYFPAMLCEMIEVGERTGRTDQVFLKLADHYDHALKLRRDFLFGIAWPMLELAIALLVLGLLIYILGVLNAEWDGKPMGVLGLHGARGLMIYCGIIGSVVAAGVGLFWANRQGWINTDPLFRTLMNLPGIGTVLRTMALSRLIWSLAMATDSDLGADKATSLAVRSTQNSYYTSKLDGMVRVIRTGQPMHTAFQQAHIYPQDFLDTLETGELSGTVSESMHRLAKDYEERAKLLYRTMAVVAGVAIFLFVAAIMIFFIINLYMSFVIGPIYDTLESQ
jgi:type II secretory pathway component PulF